MSSPSEANARVVACLNYCEGVETETLEQVGPVLLGLMDERDALKALNAELVEALERFMAGQGSWLDHCAHARAILAKVRP